MTNDILMCVCHYNNADEVISFAHHVASLQLPQHWRIHISIADNSGNWNSANQLPHIATICYPNANLGYFKGCLYALEAWRNSNPSVELEWVSIQNTDVTFDQAFFLKLTTLESGGVGVIAPHVVLPDGTPQNPYRMFRIPPRQMRTYAILYRFPSSLKLLLCAHHLKRNLKRRFRSLDDRERTVHSDDAQVIYAPHGSMMFFTREFIEAAQSYLKQYTVMMYFEESFVAEVSRKLNLKVIYFPYLIVHHNEHQSTNNTNLSQRREWLNQSANLIWKMFYSE